MTRDTSLVGESELHSACNIAMLRNSVLTITLATLSFAQSLAAEPSSTPAIDPPARDYSAPSDANYTARDVQVPTPAGHYLAGTLTLPCTASRATPVAAIVTVTGSGPQDRDENIGMGFKPFRQIAEALADRNIAVLRMDDRGIGASGGEFKGATTADFAEDVRAGLAYLREQPEIKADRLGVVGHSEGALVAPLVAEKEPSLRAIVLLSGVAEPARSALHFQIENGYEHNASLSDEERIALIAAIPAKIDEMIVGNPWLQFFVTYDPAATMRRVTTPVLILTGSRDQQAAPEQVALQEAAFKQAGNKDVTAQVLPDLNHLLVYDTDGFPANYGKLPQPLVMHKDALELIAGWLETRLR